MASRFDNKVQEQYEKYPYPGFSPFTSVPLHSLYTISYEALSAKIFGTWRSHRNKKILLAGCGVLEPLLFAKLHPHAKITALDFSRSSLRKARLLCALHLKRNVKFVHTALEDVRLTPQEYDYIQCAGVLHHTRTPLPLLKKLVTSLKDNGIIRIMVYSQSARYWNTEVKKYLFAASPETVLQQNPDIARKLVSELPKDHPVKSAFVYPHVSENRQGIVDEFLHAFENTYSVKEFEELLHNAGLFPALSLMPESMGPSALKKIVPDFSCNDFFESLEILEKLHAHTSNFLFTAVKKTHKPDMVRPQKTRLNPAFHGITGRFFLPWFEFSMYNRIIEEHLVFSRNQLKALSSFTHGVPHEQAAGRLDENLLNTCKRGFILVDHA